MINDDDIYVVIVEDDCTSEPEGKPEEPFGIKQEIKQEIIDEDSFSAVEYLLDTATEYDAEILHWKEEIDNNIMIKSEYGETYAVKLEFDADLNSKFVYQQEINPENRANLIENVKNFSKLSDSNNKYEDYEADFIYKDLYSNNNSETEIEDKPKKKRSRKKRKANKNNLKNNSIIYWRGMERKIVSYIEKLREKNQQFRDNEELLINYLAKEMKQTHRPDPPSDYYVTNGRTYICVLCNVETVTVPAAHRHYQEKHGERYLSCYACGASFRSTTNLYKHEKKNCAAPDITIVLKARARTLGRKGRSRPYIPDFSTIPPKKFNCTECSASFVNKYSLEPHLRMHRGERPFLCPHCPRAYTSAVVLSHHMRKHSTEQFICDHCRRSFKEKGKLVVHMATHAPLKKFPCNECPKRYSSKADLVTHVNRDHRNLPLPFACKICPKRFARMSVLKIHMRKMHGIVIMTINMFSRYLPEMTDTQLQQAMVVLKKQDFGRKDDEENSFRSNEL